MLNMMDAETSHDFFGFDKRLICSAIRRAGLPVNQNTCMLAQDAVADAMMKYRAERDNGKSLNLKSWVYTYVKWQIRRYVNPVKKQVSTVSLEEPLSRNDCRHYADDACLGDVVPANVDVERTAINNIMFEHIQQAISKMDTRGQFVMNFIISANNPLRCGSDLGKALSENGLVKTNVENKSASNRERARQLIQKYMGQMRSILSKMGINKPSDIYEEVSA